MKSFVFETDDGFETTIPFKDVKWVEVLRTGYKKAIIWSNDGRYQSKEDFLRINKDGVFDKYMHHIPDGIIDFSVKNLRGDVYNLLEDPNQTMRTLERQLLMYQLYKEEL